MSENFLPGCLQGGSFTVGYDGKKFTVVYYSCLTIVIGSGSLPARTQSPI